MYGSQGERALVWQDPSIPKFLEHLHLIMYQVRNNVFFSYFFKFWHSNLKNSHNI